MSALFQGSAGIGSGSATKLSKSMPPVFRGSGLPGGAQQSPGIIPNIYRISSGDSERLPLASYQRFVNPLRPFGLRL